MSTRYLLLAEGFSGDPHYGKTMRGVLRYRREDVVAILDSTRAGETEEGVPIVASVSRELFLSVPHELEEGALALGATRWEMVRGVVLSSSRPGIAAALILGVARHCLSSPGSPRQRSAKR